MSEVPNHDPGPDNVVDLSSREPRTPRTSNQPDGDELAQIIPFPKSPQEVEPTEPHLSIEEAMKRLGENARFARVRLERIENKHGVLAREAAECDLVAAILKAEASGNKGPLVQSQIDTAIYGPYTDSQ